MRLKLSLKQIWTVITLLAVGVPIAIVLIWYGQEVYDTRLDAALVAEYQKNESIRNEIDSEVRRFKALLQSKSDPLSILLENSSVAFNSDVQDVLNSLLKNFIIREESMREIVILSKKTEAIAIVSPERGITGDEVLSYEEMQSLIRYFGFDSKKEYPEIVIPSMGRDYVGSPQQYDGYIGFNIAIPIGNPAKAILLAVIEVDKLWSNDVGDESVNYIVDRRGDLLVKIDGGDARAGDLMTHLAIVRSALSESDWISDVTYTGVSGQEVFGSYAVVPSLNWILISEVASSTITQPIWMIIFKIILFTLIGAGVFVSLILYLVEKILKPIQFTSEAIDHLARGEYEFSLEPCGINELDAMTTGFNDMAKEIQERERAINSIALELSGHSSLFFQNMVVTLSNLYKTKYAFIGLFDSKDKLNITTLVVCVDGVVTDNMSYAIKDTPCEIVIQKSTYAFAENVQSLFPKDEMLKTMGVESYVGSLLYNSENIAIGLIALMDVRPMTHLNQMQPVIEIFSARAGAEIERTSTMEELRKREQDLIATHDSLSDGVITVNETGEVLTFNKTAAELFGYSAEEVIGNNVSMLMPEPMASRHDDYLRRYMTTDMKHIIGIGREVEGLHKDNGVFAMRLSLSELPEDADGVKRFIGSCQDLTYIKQKEEQLRRSQKMDALGKLTGGIAHDFNNILGIILGYSGLLSKALSEEPKLIKYASQIQHAGERGAKLTKKLLSFSQQEISEATTVDINALLKHSKNMLEKTLTARIRLNLDLEEDLWPVHLDAADLEDAIINMSINAMHSMPETGELTLHTCNKNISAFDADALDLDVGDYVYFSIKDTGCGMDAKTTEKIFDPFFSTKGEKGTGLGLTQVYGFVERCKGAIKVYSKLNRGTSFMFYFPRHGSVADVAAVTEQSDQVEIKEEELNGNENILMVDDEVALLNLTSESLRAKGYNVMIAKSAEDALELLEKESIDLMISDVIMSNMNGYQLAKIVQDKYPAIKIQLASGFTDERHIDKANENDELHRDLIHKPYRLEMLSQRVREMLDTR